MKVGITRKVLNSLLPKPYYQTKLGKLYNGDCLEIIPQLEPVDLVLTDPPYSYNTHMQSKTNRYKGMGIKHINFDSISSEQFYNYCISLLSICSGWVIMTCDHKHAPTMFEHESFVRLGAWVKNNPMPQISADRPGQGHEAVLILHNVNNRKKWKGRGKPAIWKTNVVSNAVFPTQKPLELYIQLLNDFAYEGYTVLDSFLATGTTSVACEMLGLNWIGIEVDKNKCDYAAKRIEQESKRSSMRLSNRKTKGFIKQLRKELFDVR